MPGVHVWSKCAQNTKRYIMIFFQAYNRLRLCVWRETGIWLWRTTTVFPRRDPPYRRSSVTSEYVRLGKESDKNPTSSSLQSWMEALIHSVNQKIRLMWPVETFMSYLIQGKKKIVRTCFSFLWKEILSKNFRVKLQ